MPPRPEQLDPVTESGLKCGWLSAHTPDTVLHSTTVCPTYRIIRALSIPLTLYKLYNKHNLQ